MPKFDRGMIKWQPFDSVIEGSKVKKQIMHEKEKIDKPVLSEEEIYELEQKIINAYYLQTEININYYQNGYIKNIKSKIKKIDYIYKIIYLNNQKLLFNQILFIN